MMKSYLVNLGVDVPMRWTVLSIQRIAVPPAAVLGSIFQYLPQRCKLKLVEQADGL